MGNENLICDFLGWELSNPKYPTDGYWISMELNIFDGSDIGEWADMKNGKVRIPTSNMKFHSSWDWIMLVIEKIGSMEFDNNPGLREYLRTPTWEFDIHIYSKIDDVYNDVVELIKWYNKNILKTSVV